MKKAIKIITIVTFIFVSCAKEKITHRRLSGGSWTITKQSSMYFNGITESLVDEKTNLGKVTFEKNGSCSWLEKEGKYSTIAATSDSKNGYLDIELDNEKLHLKITEYSRQQFTLEDRGIYVTTNFTGHYKIYVLEKN